MDNKAPNELTDRYEIIIRNTEKNHVLELKVKGYFLAVKNNKNLGLEK